jgi:hypothetical protein
MPRETSTAKKLQDEFFGINRMKIRTNKSEERHSSKLTVFGMDAKDEPTGMYLRRVCVGYAFSAAF